MRKMVSFQKIIDEAKNNGFDPETLVADPDGIAEIDEDTEERLTIWASGLTEVNRCQYGNTA
jgi:hypothetical protein